MKSYEGGAIPFSAILGGRNTKKRSKKRVSRTRRKVKKTKTKTKIKTSDKISEKSTKTLNKCTCKIIDDNSPNSLGFCEKCTPLNIIMKGKDKKLWKIEISGKTKKWIKVI